MNTTPTVSYGIDACVLRDSFFEILHNKIVHKQIDQLFPNAPFMMFG
jgi:hypothetical protein